jgi:hypothetical protein
MPSYDSTARVPFAKGGRVGLKKGGRGPHGFGPKPYLNKPGQSQGTHGGRKKKNIGGRANLLEEMGRIDARRHPDAADRAEKHRVIGELNRGYKKGGTVKKKDKHTLKYRAGKKGEKVGPLQTIDLVGKAQGGRVGAKKGGDGKWIQKVNASIKRRGTKGKCTPITKPGCTGRAKALAKTFKKMAAKRKKS